MKRFYDPERHRLIYVEQNADASFWDEHWRSEQPAQAILGGRDSLVLPETQRRLPAGSIVLEGGCGNGRYVYALHDIGYRCIGLDFAQQTLHQVHRIAPELRLVAGDVFALPLATASIDGCWSMGVIEHFWKGYEPIRDELFRVIRPGGYLFLTHPHLSPLRRLKARLGSYGRLPDAAEPSGFYQFALDGRRTVASFQAAGFEHLSSRPLFGDWGLGAELPALEQPLRRLARSRHRLARLCAGAINRLAVYLAGHAVLHVLRRPTEG